MKRDFTWGKRAFLIGALVGSMHLGAASPAIAQPLGPVPGDFTVVFQGIDTGTGELVFAGTKDGAIAGALTIRTRITRQTGVALHMAADWTLMTASGDAMYGANTLVLNTRSLHFREHGVIVDATGALAERVGNFIVIHGEISDLGFVVGLTQVSGHATIVPSRAK